MNLSKRSKLIIVIPLQISRSFNFYTSLFERKYISIADYNVDV